MSQVKSFLSVSFVVFIYQPPAIPPAFPGPCFARFHHQHHHQQKHHPVVYDEGELLDLIKEFCEEHQLIGHRVRRRHKTVPISGRVGVFAGGVEDISDTEELDEDKLESLKKLAVAEFVSDIPKSDEGGYFVTVSRRTGFKRLHLVGGCHVHAEKCQQAFSVSALDGVVFDSACKICKRKLKHIVDESESEESSSDGSSSSTEDSARSDNEVLPTMFSGDNIW